VRGGCEKLTENGLALGVGVFLVVVGLGGGTKDIIFIADNGDGGIVGLVGAVEFGVSFDNMILTPFGTVISAEWY
jgi:hypothetical protein